MPEIPATKVCIICGDDKLLNTFGNRKTRKDGKKSECNDCIARIKREKYWADPEAGRQKKNAYNAANREHINANDRQKRQNNLEKERRKEREYYAKNRDRVIANTLRWAKKNIKKVTANRDRRRALKRGAEKSDLTHAQWVEIQAAQDHRCYYCGKRCKGKLTQDHIIPLSQGGSHTLHNVIGACRSCNSRKGKNPAPIPVQPLLLTIAPSKLLKKIS